MQGADVQRARSAVQLLGWSGEHVVPVRFLGLSCWAVAAIDGGEHQRRRSAGTAAVPDRERLAAELEAGQRRTLAPPMRFIGGLVESADARRAVGQAALLAGYAPRAVLLRDQPSLLGVMADAALLDVGVVVNVNGGGLQLLSPAGPRVPGGQFDAREWLLLETVYAAVLTEAAAEVTAA